MDVCRETTSLNLAKLRGVTFVNQYVVIKYLGKGANGRVFLCLDMCDNRLYAVKVGLLPACEAYVAGLAPPVLLSIVQDTSPLEATGSTLEQNPLSSLCHSALVVFPSCALHDCADCEEGGHGII